MVENTKKFIIDASYLLSTLLPDESITESSKGRIKMLINKGNIFYSPRILEFEICNSIKATILSKRILISSFEKILSNFEKIPINYLDIDRKKVLELAIKNNLSFYDASYLYLAKKYKCKLLTLDKTLLKMLE